MKTLLVRMMSVFALVLGLISSQTANAQAQHNSGSPSIYNPESNQFADYTGTFTISVTYICDSPFPLTKTITAYCYLSSTETLAPSGSRDYSTAISAAAYAAASWDAYSNYEDAPVSVNVDSIDDFSFSANTGYQIQSTAPTSTNSSVSIAAGNWAPTFLDYGTGGTGGTVMFCVAGQTNWGTDNWNPVATGVYYFYVGIKTAPGYSNNVVDPIQGPMQVDGSPSVVVVY